jgi:glutamine synthetase
VAEAKRRGLPNLANTVDSLKDIMAPKNVKVMQKHGVLSPVELHARQDILVENYAATINIEGLATSQIGRRQILPVAVLFSGQVADAVRSLEDAGASAAAPRRLLKDLCEQTDRLSAYLDTLDKAIASAAAVADAEKRATAYRDLVVPAMTAVRAAADSLEGMIDADMWPLPTYAEMLFMR